MKFVNDLINETSPYLLQHAHNPVKWMPWGKKAFELAKKENKPLLISIGYSACHWCHVMERESFEDETVAQLMNNGFINIKIDREERPDIDTLYMNAVQLMTGHGGWPLNCFALADGRPIYGGTYFTKQQWIHVLQNLSRLYTNDKEKVEQYATDLINGINQAELINTKKQNETALHKSVLKKCVLNWTKQFDTEYGGPAKAPKFPMPNNYVFLLKYAYLYKDENLLKHIDLTLTKIASGGIYDQLGGGFARYSTDMFWKIPHFEKMLYDNAQLVTLYCEAYRLTKNTLYKKVVTETLAFIEKEWLTVDNGFYSALDADSEGKEGKYYIWTKEELRKILGDKFDVFSEYYNINETGYWEDDNYVLILTDTVSGILIKHNLKINELDILISNCKKLLIEQREKRVKPALDDKILAGWNGLMCKAYCDAFLTFKNPNYKNIALKNAAFIEQAFIKPDFSLWRSYKNKQAKINGFLDDYAFVIEAFISVYTITQNEKWLWLSDSLTEYTLKYFFNEQTGLFYYTDSISETLAVKTTETSDNVIPSSNSQMACNLFKLSKILSRQTYSKIAFDMLNRFSEDIIRYGSGYSNWALLYSDFLNDCHEVCIVGKDVEEKLLELYNYYIPNAIFVVSASASELEILNGRFVNEKTIIYVCKNKTCLLPSESITEVVKQLETDL